MTKKLKKIRERRASVTLNLTKNKMCVPQGGHIRLQLGTADGLVVPRAGRTDPCLTNYLIHARKMLNFNVLTFYQIINFTNYFSKT